MIRPDAYLGTALNYKSRDMVSDRKLNTKNTIPVVVGVVLLCVSAPSVFADPWSGGGAVVESLVH
jgi:hypothetical protein